MKDETVIPFSGEQIVLVSPKKLYGQVGKLRREKAFRYIASACEALNTVPDRPFKVTRYCIARDENVWGGDCVKIFMRGDIGAFAVLAGDSETYVYLPDQRVFFGGKEVDRPEVMDWPRMPSSGIVYEQIKPVF